MKKILLLLVFTSGVNFFGLCQQANINSDERIPPSDRYASGYTYDWDKGYSAIVDFILNPNGKNQEASVIVKRKDFPQILSTSGPLSSNEEKQIKLWMEAHSNEIIQAFINRNDIVTAY